MVLPHLGSRTILWSIGVTIIAWNVRGLNNSGKCREIGTRLNSLNPDMVILIETRVKQTKAINIRKKINHRWSYIENYASHNNGRIWVMWDDSRIMVVEVRNIAQFIHCGIYNLNGSYGMWYTAIYAFNTLDKRKQLWRDIGDIHSQLHQPWFLMGDYNNVLRVQDRMRSNPVHEAEYRDLV